MAITDVYSLLFQWESAGVFDIVLPFLLIFAIVYGVLSSSRALGKNKGVHLIVAIIIGLLSLRVGFVQDFFAEVFPRLGVGLAIILVVVVLVAGFVPETHRGGVLIGIYSLGFIIALMVVFNSFSELDWFGSYWWEDWGALIIGALLVIGVIVVVGVSKSAKVRDKHPVAVMGPWWKGEDE